MHVPRGVMHLTRSKRPGDAGRVELCSKGAHISWCSGSSGAPGRQCSWLRLGGTNGLAVLRLGKKKTACSVTLFSLKWYLRGRGGGLEDPAWRVPLYLVPQGGSRAETGLTVGRVPRDGWRAQGAQFRAGGEGGCRGRGSGWPPRCGDFLTGGLFRDRHAWPRRSCVSGKKEQHVPGRGG